MEHNAIKPTKPAVHKSGYLDLNDIACTMEIPGSEPFYSCFVPQATYLTGWLRCPV
jgi:hypothetical protein